MPIENHTATDSNVRKIPQPDQRSAIRTDPGSRGWWAVVLPWRWWWNASLGMIAALSLSQYWSEKIWHLLPGRMNVVMGTLFLTLWLGLAGWLFIAVPILCARDRKPRFRTAPISYFASLRFLVWVPTLLVGGAVFFELVYMTALHYYRTDEFRFRLVWWILVPALLILAATVWYGFWMTRRLEKRIRTQAAISRNCYDCGYPLHSLAGHRCPECGKAFPESAPTP